MTGGAGTVISKEALIRIVNIGFGGDTAKKYSMRK